MAPYPLLFEPLLKEKVWGGRHLERLGKTLPPGVPIGESWELADLPESIPQGRSRIANGPLAGRTLREAIEADRATLTGAARLTGDGGFPLLVKFLDACENLSVQVHPDERYVRAHPEAHLKSEAWIVLRAEPGAVIYKGLAEGVTRETFARHIESGEVVGDLCAVEVRPGECHYLPSGTCHALGAGIVVAEVQTPSDTTFRVYDWGRTGRELHVKQALECIAFGISPPPVEHGVPIEVGSLRTTPLTKCEHFGIERIEALEATRLEIVTSGMPIVWLVLAGGGAIGSTEIAPGTTTLLPAALRDAVAELRAGTEILSVNVSSPVDGLLA